MGRSRSSGRPLSTGRGRLAPVLTIILAGFTLITIISYLQTRRAAEDLAMGHAVQALRFLNLELNSQVTELRRNLAQWSNEEIFSLALADTYLGRSARKAACTRMLERIQGRDIARLLLADAQGDILASSDPSIIGAINIADRDFFQRSLHGEQVVVSYQIGRYSPFPVTIISVGVPNREQDAAAPGVMYLVLDTKRFARRILDAVRLGRSGGAVAVDLNTGLNIGPSWADPGQFSLVSHLEALQAAAQQGNVVQFDTRLPGAGNLQRMAVASINEQTGWLVAVVADTREILQPAARLATVNGVIALCILALAGLALAALNHALGSLRASEERYRALIETSPLGIATFDLDGRCSYLNRRAMEILELDVAGPFVPAWAMELQDEAGRPLPQEALPVRRALEATDKQQSWTAWWMPASGQRRALSLSAAPLAVAGQAQGVVAAMEDVTDLLAARQVLQQSKDELESLVQRRTLELTEANRRLLELDELKSAFLSTVSHDLRTPLTSILGFAKLIQREFSRRFSEQASEDPAQAKSAKTIMSNLDIIVLESERLTRLITDLLDFSRLDSGHYQWKDTPVDLTALAREAARTLAAAYADKPEVTLRLDLPNQLEPVTVDPDRLMQVMINLLSNALKFTTRGEVRLFVLDAEEVVMLGVADTGAGIPEEEHSRIFDRFYQAGSGGGTIEADNPAGAGLGLAICKQIVEHYGGSLRVESSPGVGSTFVVELPRKSRNKPPE
ncbi:hypothetical protein JCM14635_22380 [Megalodesulfovibrio paquesii]